jgi:hypothetical protein
MNTNLLLETLRKELKQFDQLKDDKIISRINTSDLTSLYNLIGTELSKRKQGNICIPLQIIKISAIEICVNGCEIERKAEEILDIFERYGPCEISNTSENDLINIKFKDYRDLQDLWNHQRNITEEISKLL